MQWGCLAATCFGASSCLKPVNYLRSSLSEFIATPLLALLLRFRHYFPAAMALRYAVDDDLYAPTPCRPVSRQVGQHSAYKSSTNHTLASAVHSKVHTRRPPHSRQRTARQSQVSDNTPNANTPNTSLPRFTPAGKGRSFTNRMIPTVLTKEADISTTPTATFQICLDRPSHVVARYVSIVLTYAAYIAQQHLVQHRSQSRLLEIARRHR